MFFIAFNSKADTITYWHVYLNKDIVAKQNINSHQDVILMLSDLKYTDTLTLKYFTCWVDQTIENSFSVLNHKDSVIESAKSIGTGSSMKMPLTNVLKYIEVIQEKDFSVVYYSDTIKGWPIIFRLKFE